MAQARALENMNQRGLLNSSIFDRAGQSALYDYAFTPIAQQDAGTYLVEKSLIRATNRNRTCKHEYKKMSSRWKQ